MRFFIAELTVQTQPDELVGCLSLLFKRCEVALGSLEV